MELTHTRLDLDAYDGSTAPHEIIDRKRGEIWLVPHTPVQLDTAIDWHTHRKENHVYIPLLPYLVQPEADLALAFMFQLGCRVQVDCNKRPIRRLHVVTGHPVHEVDSEVYGNMWQVQLGFGFVLG